MNTKEIDEEEIVDLTASTAEKCHVCGKTPASKVYGSIACAGCKVFFMRATTSGASTSKCPTDGKCLINHIAAGGSNDCFTCKHFRKATARRKGCQLREKRAQIGLKPRGRPRHDKLMNCLEETLLAMVDKEPRLSQLPPSTDPTMVVEPAIDSRELRLQSVCFSAPLISRSGDSTNMIKNFINLHNLLANDNLNESMTIDFPFSLDCSIGNFLKNPAIVCPRVPLGIQSSSNPLIPAHCANEMLVRVFVRFLLAFADWCRSTPEFLDLDEEDQIKFFARNMTMFVQFQNYYTTYKNKFDEGLITAFGIRVKLADMLHFEDAKETYYYQFHYGMNFVIPLMKRTQMEDEEYVLLKNIVLFSPDLDYKENTLEIIRKAFKKYTNALLEHLKSRYNDENQVIAMFNDLMMIPRCMQNLGGKMNRHYSSIVLTNRGNVRGSLSEEIFWRL